MEQDPEQDPLYQWYDVQDQEEYVRMIHVEKTKEIEVVLDSGADFLGTSLDEEVWEKSTRESPSCSPRRGRK